MTTTPAIPQVPTQPAPAAPKKNWFMRHKLMTGFLVLLAVIVIATQVGGGEQSSPSDSGDATTGIGDPAADGKFEFTVTKVEDGVSSIGSGILKEKAQGQFVLVHMTVENVGTEAQWLSATDQYLYDAAKREYAADDTAWAALKANPLLEQINPGNSVKGIVVFDIPKNVEPVELVLHDSMFSGGVTVSLP
ncbi:MAG: DUF4352 domain-containing protein [Actinophytocola sp.]|nr:DUF4352 domain-containing protein [Actinophytocola sp.]